MLLAPLGNVSVEEINVVATTNDVLKIKTVKHGTYYVKFHTARWYADQPDTFFVVDRECAVHELLRKRGMPLPYRAWGDLTRQVVERSVLISEELKGISLPDALNQHQDDTSSILRTFGRYMRSLHRIKFSRPGLLQSAHAYFASTTRIIPPVFSWDEGHLHRAEKLQQNAVDFLKQKLPLLPRNIAERLSKGHL